MDRSNNESHLESKRAEGIEMDLDAIVKSSDLPAAKRRRIETYRAFAQDGGQMAADGNGITVSAKMAEAMRNLGQLKEEEQEEQARRDAMAKAETEARDRMNREKEAAARQASQKADRDREHILDIARRRHEPRPRRCRRLCWRCHGTGRFRGLYAAAHFQFYAPCTVCHGTGFIDIWT